MNTNSTPRANEGRQHDRRVQGEIPVEYAYRASARHMLVTCAYISFTFLSNASTTDHKSGQFHVDLFSIFSSLLIVVVIAMITLSATRRVSTDDGILNAFIFDRMQTMIFPTRLLTYVLSLVLMFGLSAVLNVITGVTYWRKVISDDSDTLQLTNMNKVEKMIAFVAVGMRNVHNIANMFANLCIIPLVIQTVKWNAIRNALTDANLLPANVCLRRKVSERGLLVMTIVMAASFAIPDVLRLSSRQSLSNFEQIVLSLLPRVPPLQTYVIHQSLISFVSTFLFITTAAWILFCHILSLLYVVVSILIPFSQRQTRFSSTVSLFFTLVISSCVHVPLILTNGTHGEDNLLWQNWTRHPVQLCPISRTLYISGIYLHVAAVLFLFLSVLLKLRTFSFSPSTMTTTFRSDSPSRSDEHHQKIS